MPTLLYLEIKTTIECTDKYCIYQLDEVLHGLEVPSSRRTSTHSDSSGPRTSDQCLHHNHAVLTSVLNSEAQPRKLFIWLYTHPCLPSAQRPQLYS
jgi:hypothetical protein